MDVNEVKKINTTALAYIGDAVYEVEIRKHILETGQYNVDKLHRLTVRFVRAEAQAEIIKTLFDELTDKEKSLVKRARNHKSASKPKNADPIIYKWATAFECFAGFLYLSEQTERFDWLMEQAVRIVDQGNKKYERG